ncbi:hypothetical protein GMRT_10735 [Giardia muris]|uniref:U3 small nucleolar RNA-associated protein 20 domain-containing protein n=1 Tax=Giardia muris TaxID=5742 RepID=A0A4Z1TBQ1_GIAMU|nr:hypothetical protein GMRT_10735 [Giardia muris]|eukprot:TNJ30677.1 hypothetical protein GMRT_10735 [Giardia muris]
MQISNSRRDSRSEVVFDRREQTPRHCDYFDLLVHYNIDTARLHLSAEDTLDDPSLSLFSEAINAQAVHDLTEGFTCLRDEVMLNYRLLVQVLYDPHGLLTLIRNTVASLELDHTSDRFKCDRVTYLSITQVIPFIFQDLGSEYGGLIFEFLDILRLVDVVQSPELFIRALSCILTSIRYSGNTPPQDFIRHLLDLTCLVDRPLWLGLAEVLSYFVRTNEASQGGLITLFQPFLTEEKYTSVLPTLAALTTVLSCRRSNGSLHSRYKSFLSQALCLFPGVPSAWVMELVTLLMESEIERIALGELISTLLDQLIDQRVPTTTILDVFVSIAIFYVHLIEEGRLRDLYQRLGLLSDASASLLVVLCLFALYIEGYATSNARPLLSKTVSEGRLLNDFDKFHVVVSAISDHMRITSQSCLLDAFLKECVSIQDSHVYVRVYLASQGYPLDFDMVSCFNELLRDYEAEVDRSVLTVVLGAINAMERHGMAHFDTVSTFLTKVTGVSGYLSLLFPDTLKTFTNTATPAHDNSESIIAAFLLIEATRTNPCQRVEFYFSLLKTSYDHSLGFLVGAIVDRLILFNACDVVRPVFVHCDLLEGLLTAPDGLIRTNSLRLLVFLGEVVPEFSVVLSLLHLSQLTNSIEAQGYLSSVRQTFINQVAEQKTIQSQDPAIARLLCAAIWGLLYIRFDPVGPPVVELLAILSRAYSKHASFIFERHMWRSVFNIDLYPLKNPLYEEITSFEAEVAYPSLYRFEGVDVQQRVSKAEIPFRAKLMTVCRNATLRRASVTSQRIEQLYARLSANLATVRAFLRIKNLYIISVNAILPRDSIQIVQLLAKIGTWLPEFQTIISDGVIEGLVDILHARIQYGLKATAEQGGNMHPQVIDLLLKFLCPLVGRLKGQRRDDLQSTLRVILSTASLEYLASNALILTYFLSPSPFIQTVARMINLQTCTDQLLTLSFNSNGPLTPPYDLAKEAYHDLWMICTQRLSRIRHSEEEFGMFGVINVAHREAFLDIALYVLAGRIVRTGRSFGSVSGVANASLGKRAAGSSDGRRRAIFGFINNHLTNKEVMRFYGILIRPVFTRLFPECSVTQQEDSFIAFLLTEPYKMDERTLVRRAPGVHISLLYSFCNSCRMLVPYLRETRVVLAYFSILGILALYWFFYQRTEGNQEEWYQSTQGHFKEEEIRRKLQFQRFRYDNNEDHDGAFGIDLSEIRTAILGALYAIAQYLLEVGSDQEGLEMNGEFGRFFGIIYELMTRETKPTDPWIKGLVRLHELFARHTCFVEQIIQTHYLFAYQALALIKFGTSTVSMGTQVLESFIQGIEGKEVLSEGFLVSFRDEAIAATISYCQHLLPKKRSDRLIPVAPKLTRTTVQAFMNLIDTLYKLVCLTPHMWTVDLETLCLLLHHGFYLNHEGVNESILRFYTWATPLTLHQLLTPLLTNEKLSGFHGLIASVYQRLEKTKDEAEGVWEVLGAVPSFSTLPSLYRLLMQLTSQESPAIVDAVANCAAYLGESHLVLGLLLRAMTNGRDAERTNSSLVLMSYFPTHHTDYLSLDMMTKYIYDYLKQPVSMESLIAEQRRQGCSEILRLLHLFAGYSSDLSLVSDIKDLINEDLYAVRDATLEIDGVTLHTLQSVPHIDYYVLFQLTPFGSLASSLPQTRKEAYYAVTTFLTETTLGRLCLANVLGENNENNLLITVFFPLCIAESFADTTMTNTLVPILEFFRKLGLYLDWERYNTLLLSVFNLLRRPETERRALYLITALFREFRFSTEYEDNGEVKNDDQEEHSAFDEYSDDDNANEEELAPLMMNDHSLKEADRMLAKAFAQTRRDIQKGLRMVQLPSRPNNLIRKQSILDLINDSLESYSSDLVQTQLRSVFLPRLQRYTLVRADITDIHFQTVTIAAHLIAKLPINLRQDHLSILLQSLIQNVTSGSVMIRKVCRECIAYIAVLMGAENLGLLLGSIRNHCMKSFLGAHIASSVFATVLERVIYLPIESLERLVTTPTLLTKPLIPPLEIDRESSICIPHMLSAVAVRQIVAVLVCDLFSKKVQQQKEQARDEDLDEDISKTSSYEIIQLVVSTLDISNRNFLLTFIDPIFRGCSTTRSLKHQTQILKALIMGLQRNSTLTSSTLLDFVKYFLSSDCFYRDLSPKVLDSRQAPTREDKLARLQNEDDDEKRSAGITDLRNEHMFLEPAPKRPVQSFVSATQFSDVGSSYDPTLPEKLTSFLLRQALSKYFGSPYYLKYQAVFNCLAGQRCDIPSDIDMNTFIPDLPSPPTLTAEHFDAIVPYVSLFVASPSSECRANAMEILCVIFPHCPTLQTTDTTLACCKTLYRASNPIEVRSCIRFLQIVQAFSPKLLTQENYAMILQVGILLLQGSKETLSVYLFLRDIVQQRPEQVHVEKLIAYYVRSLHRVDDGVARQAVAEAVGYYINSYDLSTKRRTSLIRDVVKYVADTELTDCRLTALACLFEIYRGISAETCATITDLSVLSLIVASQNTAIRFCGVDDCVTSIGRVGVQLVHSCLEVGYTANPLRCVEMILKKPVDGHQSFGALSFLCYLAEQIWLVATDTEAKDEYWVGACGNAMSVLAEVIEVVKETIFEALGHGACQAMSLHLLRIVISIFGFDEALEEQVQHLRTQAWIFICDRPGIVYQTEYNTRTQATALCDLLISQGASNVGVLCTAYISNLCNEKVVLVSRKDTAISLATILKDIYETEKHLPAIFVALDELKVAILELIQDEHSALLVTAPVGSLLRFIDGINKDSARLELVLKHVIGIFYAIRNVEYTTEIAADALEKLRTLVPNRELMVKTLQDANLI